MTGFPENLLALTAVLTFAIGAPGVYDDVDACVEDRKGVCKLLRECPSAQEKLQEHGIWPDVCKLINNDALICCTEKGIKTPHKTTETTHRTPATTSETIHNLLHLVPRKSDQKCREYSQWEEPPTLALTWEKISGPCGIANQELIYGGVVAEPMEFPHMAHLGYLRRGRVSFKCGGSLISEQFIMTAAHCIEDTEGNKVSHVRLGSGADETRILTKVRRIIPHPEFKIELRYHDIALLELESPLMEFNNFIRPACLHTLKKIDTRFGTASGWGATEFGKEKSKKLLKVELPFVDATNCSQTYESTQLSLPVGLDDKSMLCAGGVRLNKDTCQGDSGGPLQIVRKEPQCMYNIVGVTSFGAGCGRLPGVYTRVSHYVPWIESIVWPDRQ